MCVLSVPYRSGVYSVRPAGQGIRSPGACCCHRHVTSCSTRLFLKSGIKVAPGLAKTKGNSVNMFQCSLSKDVRILICQSKRMLMSDRVIFLALAVFQLFSSAQVSTEHPADNRQDNIAELQQTDPETPHAETESRIQAAEQARGIAEAERNAAYYALTIGLAEKRLEEENYLHAYDLLEACPENLRDWEWGCLKYQNPLRKCFPGNHLCFSLDRHFIASIRDDGVDFYEFPSLRKKAESKTGGKYHIGNVVFAPGSDRCLIVDEGRCMFLCNPATGEILEDLGTAPESDSQHYLWDYDMQRSLRSMRLSKDGQWLAAVNDANRIRVFGLKDGHFLIETAGAAQFGFSEDNRYFFLQNTNAKDDDPDIDTVFDLKTGNAVSEEKKQELLPACAESCPVKKKIALPGIPEKAITEISPDGEYVLQHTDNGVALWTSSNAQKIADLRAALVGFSTCSRFSPENHRWYNDARPHALHVFNLESGEAILSPRMSHLRNPNFDSEGQYLVGSNMLFAVGSPFPAPWLKSRYSYRVCANGFWILAEGMDGRLYVTDGVRPDHATAVPDCLSPDQVRTADVAPDGRRLLTLTLPCTASLWDLSSQKLLRTLEVKDADASGGVIFSPDGRRALAFAGDNIVLWDTEDGKELARLPGTPTESSAGLPSGAIGIFSADQPRCLLYGGKIIALLNSETGSILQKVEGLNRITSCFSGNEEVSLLNKTASRLQRGTRSEDHCVEQKNGLMGFTGDSRRAFACSQELTEWDAKSGREIGRLERQKEIRNAEVSNDTTRVLVWFENEAVLWDTQHGKEIATIPFATVPENSWPRHDLGFSNDGKLAWVGLDSCLALMDAATGKIVSQIAFEAQGGDFITEHPLPYTSMAEWTIFRISPDKSTILARNQESGEGFHGDTLLFDAESGKLIERYEQTFNGTYSPDGTIMACTKDDGTVLLIESRSGRIVRELRGHTDLIDSFMFISGGRRLLTSSLDESVRMWDTASGNELLDLGLLNRVWNAWRPFFYDEGTRTIVGSAEDSQGRISLLVKTADNW